MKGLFKRFDTEVPRIVVESIAAVLGKTTAEFLTYVYELISERLALEILSHLLGTGEPYSFELPGCSSCDQLVRLGLKQISPESKGGLHVRFALDYPLIALGAPGDIYLRRTADLLGTRCIVPPRSAVANAVGAVTGNVVCTVKCAVVPIYDTAGITGYRITQAYRTARVTRSWRKPYRRPGSRQCNWPKSVPGPRVLPMWIFTCPSTKPKRWSIWRPPSRLQPSVNPDYRQGASARCDSHTGCQALSGK